MAEITLTVSRHELATAIAYLKKMAPKAKFAKTEVVLDLAEDSVALSLATIRATLPAVCSGVGRVFIAGLALQVLSMTLSSLDAADVQVRIGETMLHLGRTSVPCRWTERQPTVTLLLPMNAELLDILALRYRFSQAEISAAALQKPLSEAEDQKASLIAKAAQTLKPLRVSATDLDNLVTERIREHSKRHDI